MIVLSSASAKHCLDPQGRLHLPFRTTPDRLMSEGAFVRWIDTPPAQERQGKGAYALDDVARLSGLSAESCQGLAAFDVVAPVEGTYAYRDLATAKQVAQLVRQGVPVLAIVQAARELGARGLRLSEVRLAAAPWGELVQRIGGEVASLDGQLALVLDETAADPDRCFEQAQRCEYAGDLDDAERFYRRAERIDKVDPIIPFNRGNVLAAMTRIPEAMIAFRQALRRDRGFAEAAFNLAMLYERVGRVDEALAFYGHAIEAHPTYAQAIFNRARILTTLDRFDEALRLWERFIEIAPGDPDMCHASRLSLLCRMKSVLIAAATAPR